MDLAAISPRIKSLSYDLELYCDRQTQKRMLLTWIFVGGLLGCLLNIAIYIKSEKRKMVFAVLGIIYGLSHLGIFLFTNYEEVVAFCLMAMSFCIMIGNSYGFTLMNEYFSGDLAKTSTIFIKLSKGIIGIMFAFFCFVINASAKILFLVMGIVIFLTAAFLLNYKNEKGIKDVMRKTVRY